MANFTSRFKSSTSLYSLGLYKQKTEFKSYIETIKANFTAEKSKFPPNSSWDSTPDLLKTLNQIEINKELFNI